MMRFGLIYRIWAFQAVRAIGPWGERTGLSFWAGARGPGVSMSLPFSLGLVNGPARLFFKPYQLPPSPWLWRAWERAVSFLESGETSTWPFRASLVRALSPSTVL